MDDIEGEVVEGGVEQCWGCLERQSVGDSGRSFGEDGSYFLGRPLDKCLLFTNSLSSTIQNDPKSSSYLTKHLCSDKFVRIAFYSD